ncbi:MAG: hypothetical protein ABI880_15395 [Acidobacteriota bacterium]
MRAGAEGEGVTSPARAALVALLVLTTLSAAVAADTFTGTISDAICALDGHASMRMGPTEVECARACADSHESPFVLVVGDAVYALSNQTTAATFAAQHVTVTGTLDAAKKTIQVDSIVAAP